MNDELHHHGIKGQRWGIRRFQKKDGSLTPAGEKRYNDNNTKKSKHRTKLETRYMDNGLSPEAARKAANDRIKTEKILAGIATVTVVAASAYLINKHVKERTDQLIKAGDNFQRIESRKTLLGSKDRNLHDAFYVTNNSRDNLNYKDAFGQQKKSVYGKAYKLNIQAKSDMKIASQKKAADTLMDLVKNDKEFRGSVYSSYLNSDLRGQHKIPKKQVDRIISGKKTSRRLIQQVYDNFNSNLVGAPETKDVAKSRNIFYNALKKQGYSGIQDINDLKWSRLRGTNPLIIFDKDKTKVTNVENIVKQVSEKSRNDAYRRMKTLVGRQAVASSLPKIAGVSTTVAGLAYIRGPKQDRKMTKYIRNYRRLHPNTKLSDRKIAQMYAKQL